MRKNLMLFPIGLLFLVSCSSKPNPVVYDKELSGFSYPFPVKTFILSTQNQRLSMRYMDIGEEKSKKIAVLLHGKNFSGFYWEKIAKQLLSLGYRLIVPDQIGFGKSSKPNYYQFSMAQFASNTNQLLKSIGVNKYKLVGHSMGGMIAVQMSYMYPEKVDSLILINPIGLETYLDYVQYQDPELFYKSELSKTLEDFRNYQRKNYYAGAWKDEYEKLLSGFAGQRLSEEWPIVAWNNALTYGPIFSGDIVSKFSKLKMKVNLILGTRDRTAPGRAFLKTNVSRDLGDYKNLGKEILLQNKRVHLVELPGLGHMPQFEDYERFSKAFYPMF